MDVTYGTLPQRQRQLNSYGWKEHLFHFSVILFLLPSLLLSGASPALSVSVPPPLLSWDPSSIRLNSSSKPSTPPHPPPCVSHSSLFWFYELDVLCLLYAPVRHFKSKAKSTHIHSPHTHTHTSSLASCPRWVEQKVVVISSPLGHNGRSCAAPTECNVLFWRQQGQSTERY